MCLLSVGVVVVAEARVVLLLAAVLLGAAGALLGATVLLGAAVVPCGRKGVYLLWSVFCLYRANRRSYRGRFHSKYRGQSRRPVGEAT